MMTKFNKDMYVKMRSKKDEPLSNIGKKVVRVTGKGPSVTPLGSVTPIVSVTETTRMASPATLVEEIPTSGSKRPRVSGKEKEKVDSFGHALFRSMKSTHIFQFPFAFFTRTTFASHSG